jgi:uncharacterized protein (DUF1778 family)
MMGRPPKPENEVKNNFLRIRLTDAERALLDKAAEAQGEETSTWLRTIALEKAKKLVRRK